MNQSDVSLIKRKTFLGCDIAVYFGKKCSVFSFSVWIQSSHTPKTLSLCWSETPKGHVCVCVVGGVIILDKMKTLKMLLWHYCVTFFRARGEKKMNALQCARYVYKTEGIRGFYRGLTASYAGISETMICFLIYETLKKELAESQLTSRNGEQKGALDFLSLMLAAAISKGCASCIAYPHGKCLQTPVDLNVKKSRIQITNMSSLCRLQRSSGQGCARKAASTNISSKRGG